MTVFLILVARDLVRNDMFIFPAVNRLLNVQHISNHLLAPLVNAYSYRQFVLEYPVYEVAAFNQRRVPGYGSVRLGNKINAAA